MASNYVIAGIDGVRQTFSIKLTILYVDRAPEDLIDDRKEFPSAYWCGQVIEKINEVYVTRDFTISNKARMLLNEAGIVISVDDDVIHACKINRVKYIDSPRPSAPIPIPVKDELSTPFNSPQ